MAELQSRGRLDVNTASDICAETRKSRPQVSKILGSLELYGNVAFEANTAGEFGGAVSFPPFDIGVHLPIASSQGAFLRGLFGSLRQPNPRIRWW